METKNIITRFELESQFNILIPSLFQDTPPAYDLSNIKDTPFYVYSGAYDQLSNEQDLQHFFEKLPNQVLKVNWLIINGIFIIRLFTRYV